MHSQGGPRPKGRGGSDEYISPPTTKGAHRALYCEEPMQSHSTEHPMDDHVLQVSGSFRKLFELEKYYVCKAPPMQVLILASYPGPTARKRKGLIHCLRMRLISQKSWENRGLPCYIRTTTTSKSCTTAICSVQLS